ncbi:gustatory receptor for sugar taste 43a-like isoform X1 [Vespa velutina]|uniref:gustatory receptor for sugar taste 43a-like isoform X1 n=2 Tax=Vespa velutina TaxID=202808 RepID=UPI001FB3C5BD|nr:gustatory receptor for sugar taste 43a-like isoform X1 [Vespa velutina]XP_047352203.1 gustatory receptor for sugar taste 43a-like isoform X1 [Vespa velutina]XP_047352204.1 gustatory receptor for sugar taste 43a-like isoform X1 [Vespa velutina]
MYFLIRKEFYDNTICEENILPVERVKRVEGTTEETKMHAKWNKHENRKRGNVKVSNIKNENMTINRTIVNSDIFQALFPIYHISKACGLLPVRFTKQAHGRYQGHLEVFNVIYCILLLGVIMGLEVWGLWREMKDGWENSIRLKSHSAVIPTCSDILGVIILAIIAVLGSPFRWKHGQIVLNKLAEIDETLGIVEPKKTRRYTIVLFGCAFTYLFIITSLDMCWWDHYSKANKKMSDKGPFNYTPLYIMYMIIIILEIQYSLITYNVCQRFVRLNKCLEGILKTGKVTDHFRKDLGLAGDIKTREQPASYIRISKALEWYPVGFETKNFANYIAQLVTVHSSLCDTVSSINNAFGLVMVVITLTCLLHLIITPYFLIDEVNGNRQWLSIIDQTLWCILHVTRMLIIIQPTYSTTIQAQKTAVLVSQLLSSNPDVECRKHLEVFSLQILHRPLDFTACGLFSLDRSLVTSIAGAVTTYLVILIQFQKEDTTKDDVDNILKNATQILKNASSLHNFTTIKHNNT